MNYTFDQGHIQDDRTGNFLKDIEVKARCKAFSNQSIKNHRILISADKSVRIWDSFADHYTTCHSLSRPAQLRIIKANVR